jgi:hypothetical protein
MCELGQEQKKGPDQARLPLEKRQLDESKRLPLEKQQLVWRQSC